MRTDAPSGRKPAPHGDALLKPGHDYELRGSEIVVAGNTRGVMSNDKLRETVDRVREDYDDVCNELLTSTPDGSLRDIEMRRFLEAFTDLYEAALADSADAPPEVTDCLCRRCRPHVDCPVHGPIVCVECGSRQPGHAEGCTVIDPDDGTPPEIERPDAAPLEHRCGVQGFDCMSDICPACERPTPPPSDAALPLELRPMDAGYHHRREKEAVKLAKAKENLEAALSSDAAPVITNEDLRSIWDAQFNVDLGGKQQEAIRAAIAAVVARHLALYAPSDAAPVAWLAEDHLFTPVRRSLHFEESTARAHHGTHEADSDEPIPLYAHPEDAAPGTCSQCGGETYVVEITCCRNCSNEFYTRAQSLAASRALGLVHGRPGSPAAHPETAPRPDKASQGSTDSGGERPEQVEDAPWISQYFRRQLERALVLIRRNVLPVDLPNAESRLQEAIRFLDTHPEDAPEGPWFVEHKDGCLQPAVFREAPFRVAFTGTWKECVAVRDILNCPKDAPGGPWEAVHDGKKRKTTVQLYRRPDNRYIRGLETEAEAIAVRDALNRLKGVET